MSDVQRILAPLPKVTIEEHALGSSIYTIVSAPWNSLDDSAGLCLDMFFTLKVNERWVKTVFIPARVEWFFKGEFASEFCEYLNPQYIFKNNYTCV